MDTRANLEICPFPAAPWVLTNYRYQLPARMHHWHKQAHESNCSIKRCRRIEYKATYDIPTSRQFLRKLETRTAYQQHN